MGSASASWNRGKDLAERMIIELLGHRGFFARCGTGAQIKNAKHLPRAAHCDAKDALTMGLDGQTAGSGSPPRGTLAKVRLQSIDPIQEDEVPCSGMNRRTITG
ncbi:MAG: hypothetical protein EpisKO_32060 [Epibacterium sp.]